jgi:hypothetical protein
VLLMILTDCASLMANAAPPPFATSTSTCGFAHQTIHRYVSITNVCYTIERGAIATDAARQAANRRLVQICLQLLFRTPHLLSMLRQHVSRLRTNRCHDNLHALLLLVLVLLMDTANTWCCYPWCCDVLSPCCM